MHAGKYGWARIGTIHFGTLGFVQACKSASRDDLTEKLNRKEEKMEAFLQAC